MLDFKSLIIGALLGGGGLVLLWFISVLLSQPERNQKLIEWARTVPISDEQKFAMEYLWNAHLEGAPYLYSFDLIKETLKSDVTKEDWEYILKICDVINRPPEFGSVNLYDTHCRYWQSKGYAEEVARIILGMKLNGFAKRFVLEQKQHEKKMKKLTKRFKR